jgi:hypothetical protein
MGVLDYCYQSRNIWFISNNEMTAVPHAQRMHTADVKAIYKTEIKPENYTLHHFVQGIV